MFKFEKMIAWQKGIDFADRAFEIADRWPQRYQFSLSRKLRDEEAKYHISDGDDPLL